jgi:hypothetical protein
MTIELYFNTRFKAELSQLGFQKPNNLILRNAESFGIDKTTLFFGGKEWDNCESDMRVSANKGFFALSLFAMVCNDVNMHANFRKDYSKFKGLTQYPKLTFQ